MIVSGFITEEIRKQMETSVEMKEIDSSLVDTQEDSEKESGDFLDLDL